MLYLNSYQNPGAHYEAGCRNIPIYLMNKILKNKYTYLLEP